MKTLNIKEIPCPKCGNDLLDIGGKRIKWRTVSGKSRSSLLARTRYTRIWKCLNCLKYFAPRTKRQIITEVELAK